MICSHVCGPFACLVVLLCLTSAPSFADANRAKSIEVNATKKEEMDSIARLNAEVEQLKKKLGERAGGGGLDDEQAKPRPECNSRPEWPPRTAVIVGGDVGCTEGGISVLWRRRRHFSRLDAAPPLCVACQLVLTCALQLLFSTECKVLPTYRHLGSRTDEILY